MAALETFYVKWEPRFLSIMRIVVAFVFFEHGSQKLFGFPAAAPPNLPAMLKFAGGLELCGGLLVLIGLFTRPVAFILAGEMAVAYFTAHAPGGFWPVANHGEPAVLYCFLFLYMAVAGGGEWSLDNLIWPGSNPQVGPVV